MISYELPMAIAVASPLLLANSLSLREIVDSQAGFNFGVIPRWSIFQFPAPQFFAFILYLIASFAETNRIPFDLPEAENELVAGYHTEYSSMNFAAFFMAEYANMVTVSSLAALVFLGGWHPLWPVEYGSNLFPALLFAVSGLIMIYHGINQPPKRGGRSLPVIGVIFLGIGAAFLVPVLTPYISPLFWFAAKAGGILFFFVWVRGTLPRFRYDQLMKFAWVFMFPVSLLHLFATGLLLALFAK
jgi:NADH-quinone oxidoreductase subunit H